MESLTQASEPAAKRSGLRGVTWHLRKHSHATMLDVVGTPIGDDAIPLGAFGTGDHARGLSTRDTGGAASCSKQRRETAVWTQIGPDRFSKR